MKKLIIPKNLKLGCATAATQIEGGDKNCNWYHWSQQGKLAGNASSISAADHYNRIEEDIGLLKELNQEVYRMSVEWSRFEPEEGRWSDEGIKHYQDEIKMLIEAGIAPLVTLHHFSQPQWLEEKGAWTNKKTVDYFIRFVEKVVASIGNEVSEYCTINEPNVFANDTYMDAKYPSGRTDDIIAYFKAAKNLSLAHLRAYETIHRTRYAMGHNNTMVGIVIHVAHFERKDDKLLTKNRKKTSGLFFPQNVFQRKRRRPFHISFGSGISF